MNKFIDEVYDVITSGGIGFSFRDTSISVLQNEIEIIGCIQFNQKYKDIQLQDEYLIQILFPLNFPDRTPIVKEIKGRIPSSADYHNNKENNGLCLGVPGEIDKKIHANPTFKYLISEIVIPFLYANTFREKYNKYPWETRQHGAEGIIDYYQKLFGFNDRNTTQNFLLNIAFFRNFVKGHNLCPCGSGKQFRNCHKSKYDALVKYHSHKNIQKDILQILRDYNPYNIDKLVTNMYTKKWYQLFRISIRELMKKSCL